MQKQAENAALRTSSGACPQVDRQTRSRLYFVWRKMVLRCTDPDDPAFDRYGARGIGVSDAWRSSFDTFIADMGASYVDGLTLERVENEEGYSAENCRWATRFEQQANTRKTRLIEHDGLRLPAREWGRRTGVDYRTILRRIDRGVSVADAMKKGAA
jgi:hypothetical protein